MFLGKEWYRAAIHNLGYAYPWGYVRNSRGYTKCQILLISFYMGVRDYQKFENPLYRVQVHRPVQGKCHIPIPSNCKLSKWVSSSQENLLRSGDTYGPLKPLRGGAGEGERKEMSVSHHHLTNKHPLGAKQFKVLEKGSLCFY